MFFIYDCVKWVGVLCWDVELGGGVGVGGMSGENLPH